MVACRLRQSAYQLSHPALGDHIASGSAFSPIWNNDQRRIGRNIRDNPFNPCSQRLWQEKTTFGSQRNFRRHGFQLAGYNNGLHHRLCQNRSFRNLIL